jgi:hypothetical protein
MPLHSLCEKCRRLANEWRALDCVQEYREQSISSWPASLMCSVLQLTQSAKACHLCRFVLSSLDRHMKFDPVVLDGMLVFFSVRLKNGMISYVAALMAKKQPLAEGEGKHFASFMLGGYHGEFQIPFSTKYMN